MRDVITMDHSSDVIQMAAGREIPANASAAIRAQARKLMVEAAEPAFIDKLLEELARFAPCFEPYGIITADELVRVTEALRQALACISRKDVRRAGLYLHACPRFYCPERQQKLVGLVLACLEATVDHGPGFVAGSSTARKPAVETVRGVRQLVYYNQDGKIDKTARIVMAGHLS